MSKDYNATLNLPKTEFPMRAGLPQKEPVQLEVWEKEKQYERLMKNSEGKPRYILHDGPPYANADIHLGTAMDKMLKDFIIRYKNMSGFQAPYVPGFDMHGLPIELKAMKKISADQKALAPLEIRKLCREFALASMKNQIKQFKRLGVTGDWENPYLTLLPDYEAKQIEIFGEMAKKGYIYKGLKPVYWCPHDRTALAEAEIEYMDDACDSIYVKFRVSDDKGKLTALGADLSKTYVLIWTTTTWTLPGNVAICLGPDFTYAIVKAEESFYIVAETLVENVMRAANIDAYEKIGTLKGRDLEYMTARHPFLDRESLMIVGNHVTLESGTGCVHTAPGHGLEDFEVCRNYAGLPIVVPVDDTGRLTAEAGSFQGLLYTEANREILESLRQLDALFAVENILHPYPHCWRCNSSVIFRATEQWFCSIDAFKEEVYRAVDSVKWTPAWGKERITGMVRDRSDWCISRQRIWGVPIPIFYCEACGKEIINDETIKAVANRFRKEGADAWYRYEAEALLPQGYSCPFCGASSFTKENDIMDVWFDSGVSHAAVLRGREELAWPADLYLEGADQYRGWFQSSMLTSVATYGSAPYKAVLTHGWVVDGEGRKMSKSLGNGIDPGDVVKEYGADILRLWVASSDYQSDVRISKDILKQLSEIYRKIRNTARFILGNLNGFDPDADVLSEQELEPIDRWALYKLEELTGKVRKAYDDYEFHVIFHSVHNFCVLDMSNFYLDVIKNRLYVEKVASKSRKAAQATIYRILHCLVRMIAPILAFTAEEIWSYMPLSTDDEKDSVFYNTFPEADGKQADQSFVQHWEQIMKIRDVVKKALEKAREEKVIGGSLEAAVQIKCSEKSFAFLAAIQDQLTDLFIVSSIGLEKEESFAEEEEITVIVAKAAGGKCERCWTYSDTVGKCAEHPEICARCALIID